MPRAPGNGGRLLILALYPRAMRSLALILLLLPTAPALAQSLDCGAPQRQGDQIPLYLDLQGLKGVPKGVTGQVAVTVPAGPPQECAPAPHLPTDVLHGDPGDALHGNGSADILQGPGRPTVQYGPATR